MKYVSLFAGIGGFDLALSRLGHSCVYANEWNKYATQIYEKNFGSRPDTRDVRTVTAGEIPNHDLLCGGFPCQAFSTAGKRRGFDDSRGTLFFEVARVAAAKRPAYLLLENVKGLLNHDNGRTFQTILRTLDDVGYDLQWQVCNSKDFGVPQNRERVFIIGNLRGVPRPEVFPLGEYNPAATTQLTRNTHQGYRIYHPAGVARTLLSQTGGVGAKTGLYAVKVSYQDGERSIGLKEVEVANTLTASYSNGADAEGKNIVIPVVTPDRVHKHQNGRRCKTDGEPAFTLTAQDRHGILIQDGQLRHRDNANTLDANYYKGLDSYQRRTGVMEVRIRRLTPLECERLQGFPDGWTEGVSDTQRYTCLGNAVTVNVVQAIAERLNHVLVAP